MTVLTILFNTWYNNGPILSKIVMEIVLLPCTMPANVVESKEWIPWWNTIDIGIE